MLAALSAVLSLVAYTAAQGFFPELRSLTNAGDNSIEGIGLNLNPAVRPADVIDFVSTVIPSLSPETISQPSIDVPKTNRPPAISLNDFLVPKFFKVVNPPTIVKPENPVVLTLPPIVETEVTMVPTLRPIVEPEVTMVPTLPPIAEPEVTMVPTLPPIVEPEITVVPTLPPIVEPEVTIMPTPRPVPVPSSLAPTVSTVLPNSTASPLGPQREPSSTLPPTGTSTSILLNPKLEPAEIEGFGCINGDGYYGIMGHCDSFIECYMLQPRQMVCPDGLLFNPYKLFPEFPCSYPSEVKCEGVYKQIPRPTEQCPQQFGYFTAPGGECSKYIMCEHGKAILMTCPFGLVFNDVLASCDWPINVPQCNPDAFRGFTCPMPDPYEDEFNSVITKFRYGNECTTYIACERGAPRYLSCPGRLVFDEITQTCVHPSLVPECATLGPLNDKAAAKEVRLL